MTGTAIQIVNFLMEEDKSALWDIEPHKEKRSLSQNAYYWVLCEKVAVKTQVPPAVIHNIHLRELHLVERIDDKPITVYLPDTDEAENKTLKSVTYHLAPTRSVKAGNDGITYRAYVMLRGSSDLNTEEMTALLDLMIQDAKQHDIEVMTPDQLAHLRELEKQRNGKKHN